MRTSADRILTTHTGSLPRPSDLVEALNAKELGRDHNEDALNRRVRQAIAEIVRRQAGTGLDVINDGESRWVEGRQLAWAVAFLASNDASFITGSPSR